jgi:hypothetical protein
MGIIDVPGEWVMFLSVQMIQPVRKKNERFSADWSIYRKTFACKPANPMSRSYRMAKVSTAFPIASAAEDCGDGVCAARPVTTEAETGSLHTLVE